MDLETAVKMWPTPCANEDAAGTPGGKMQKMLGNHPGIRGETPEEWKAGALHPSFVSWMMGWPLGFESLDDLPPNSMADWDQAMADGSWWIEEPDIPRVGKNIPARKDRLKVLGNGMVPICFVAAVLDLLQLVESLDEN